MAIDEQNNISKQARRMKNENPSTSLTQLKALDSLRGLSAMAVFVAHFCQQFLRIDSLGWLGSALELLGVVGVAVFFVLSGFLIHLGTMKEQERTGSVDWGTYARRRFFRIVPAYVVSLIVYSAATHYLTSNMISPATPVAFVSHLFFFSSFVPGEYQSINAIFWTVVVELHFYAMYPPLRRITNDWPPLGVFFSTWLFGLAFFFTATALTQAGEVRVMWQHTAPVLFWKWTLGMLLAHIYFTGNSNWIIRILSSKLILIPLLACIWAGTLFWQAPSIELNYKRFILPFLCTALVGLFLFSEIRQWRSRILEWLGDISYSIYLWHPLALAVTAWIGATSIGANSLISLFITLLFSWVSHRAIEMPSISWGKKNRPRS